MTGSTYTAGAGAELDPLLVLPVCPWAREDGAECLEPVSPDPGAVGRVQCLGGHAWREGLRRGERARMWSDADRHARALVRRGVLYVTAQGRYALTPWGHIRRAKALGRAA